MIQEHASAVTTVTENCSQASPRRIVLLMTILYVVAFHITYRDLVFPQQAFWGADYRPLSWEVLTLIYGACIIPSLWMPVRFQRPSLLLFYIQYYLIYIPATFLLFYTSRPRLATTDALSLLGWMFVGISVLQACYFFPLLRVQRLRIAPSVFWGGAGLFWAALFLYMASILHSNFQLVSLGEIYSVRAAQGELIQANGGALLMYAQFWIDNVGLPLTFALGVFSKRWWISGVALLLYMFVFGISGQKNALLAIAYLPAFFLLFSHRSRSIGSLLATALAIALLAGYLFSWLSPQLLGPLYIAIVNFRTFTVQAVNLVQYYAFFQSHTVTHLSHLSGFKWFFQYPYKLDIPHTLGYYYYGTPIDNNSGMWATDAIGGLGVWAIPLISACAAILFWFLDCCARPFQPRFVALALVYIATTFANVSLGTTVISGGLMLLYVILLSLPTTGRFAKSYLRIA